MSSVEEKVFELVNQLTIEEKISLLSTSQSEIKRLGIQEYHVGGEAAHGVVDRSGGKTTSFPQPLGLSQTWNPELLKEVGTAIGEEARILYKKSENSSWLTLWAPTIDMERDPRWGRNEEAYGEDPYLTGELSVGLIKGMQGDKEEAIRLAAAPKHFFGNNNERGRENTSNSIDPRNREEYYLKAFKPAFTKAKAQSMMTAYNGINGVPCMQSEEMEKTLRGKWEMDGFIVCDGGALSLNVDRYHYYETYEEALADALKKGIDCFVDSKELVETAAKKALEKELISEDDLTRAVRNILRVRTRLGHFSTDFIYDTVDPSLLAGEKHAALAEKVTEEQIVLLKNEGLLPLSKDQKVLLTGPLADVFLKDWYGGYPPYEITIRNALESLLPKDKFDFTPSHDRGHFETLDGEKLVIDQNELKISMDPEIHSTIELEDWGFDSFALKDTETERYLQLNDETNTFQLNKQELYDWFVKEKWIRKEESKWLSWHQKPVGITNDKKIGTVTTSDPLHFNKEWDASDQAVEKAKKADVTIAVIGNHPLLNGRETEDRPAMNIPEHQLETVQALYEVNPNVIVIIVGSYPFEIQWIKDHIPSVLFTTHGSQELGTAIKNVLYHQAAPSGKLSQTWYQDTSKLPDITDYDVMKGKRTYRYTDLDPLFPFGHGLTYGDLKLTDAAMNQNVWKKEDKVELTVELSNKHNYPVTDTLQIYTSIRPKQALLVPEKQLIAFKKIMLKAGETRAEVLEIEPEELCYFDVFWDRMVFPTGEGKLSIGFSSEHIIKEIAFKTDGEIRKERQFKKETHFENYDDYEGAYITLDRSLKKAVYLSSKGWLMFRDVRLSDSSSIVLIRYSANNEGILSVFSDPDLKVKAGEVQFQKTLDSELELLIETEPGTSLYFSTSEPIYLRMIKER